MRLRKGPPGRRERSGLKIQGIEGEGGREKRTGRDTPESLLQD